MGENCQHGHFVFEIDIMREKPNVTTTLRLNKEEQRATEEKCLEINRLLIDLNRMPMQESELLHFILRESIHRLTIDSKGELTMNYRRGMR